MEIVVVGSLNLDFMVQAKRFPRKGETLMGENSMMSFGGKGANQAVCAAKLGANVSMIGCLGDDANGKLMLDNMKSNKVNIENIQIVQGIASGIAQITIAENDNTIIIVPGANEMVNKDVINQAKDVLLKADIVMLQLEIPLSTVEYVVDFCHQNNIKTILNPAPATSLPIDLIKKVTYMTPNEIELKQLFKDKMESILIKYPNKIIVTAGSDGVYFHDGIKLCNIKANKVKVVNTTGAGDAFNGAFAYAITNGDSVSEAIVFGNKIAGYSIGKLGAQTSMPTEEEVK